MSTKLRINFVLPPIAKITGGPLAILEYANRFAAKGHKVTVTTYPDSLWKGDDPFPWFKLNGEYHYLKDRGNPNETIEVPELRGMPFAWLAKETKLWAKLIAAMPECDINIATWWLTSFPVFFSRKGKPTYFMQHYEEVFYGLETDEMLQRLAVRASYGLPMFKVANSTWLQRQMLERYGQHVPFSNNALAIEDFNPTPKKSERDGIMRVVTYSSKLQWKGFADAVAAMEKVYAALGSKVEWHVFGYAHPNLPQGNSYAPYTYHPNLSFKELANLYAGCDVGLCPSWYESFPLPPLEAMASGTAVVTTEFGTEDYAFHGKNALVVGSRDSNQMADAVLQLLRDPALRSQLAAEGRKTAEGFGWDKAVDRREEILLGIHSYDHGYSITRSAEANLIDGTGAAFERAPNDVQRKTGLYWIKNSLYLLHDGVRHHVKSQDLIPELLNLGVTYMEPDLLMHERTPPGLSLVTLTNLPAICFRETPREQA